MLFLFEAGGRHPRMAYVLDGDPASASRKPAPVPVGSRFRSPDVASNFDEQEKKAGKALFY